MRKYTPENITSLEPNEVFVFGSNRRGAHEGGAARVAYEEFGATWGEGEGHTGQSYAIPTLDENFCLVTENDLETSLAKFIDYVCINSQLTFYLTKIGCGIAGWDIEKVKEIFWRVIDEIKPHEDCYLPVNLVIPREFDR